MSIKFNENIEQKIEDFCNKNRLGRSDKIYTDEVLNITKILLSKGASWNDIEQFLKEDMKIEINIKSLKSVYHLKEKGRKAIKDKSDIKNTFNPPSEKEENKNEVEEQGQKDKNINVVETEKESNQDSGTELKILEAGEEIEVRGKRYIQKERLYISDDPELEKSIDKLESDINKGRVVSYECTPEEEEKIVKEWIAGKVQTTVKLDNMLWIAYCCRYEGNEVTRDCIRRHAPLIEVPKESFASYMRMVEKRYIQHLTLIS